MVGPELQVGEWRDVVGLEGYYVVAKDGRVYRLPRIDNLGRRVAGRMIDNRHERGRYISVRLSVDAEIKEMSLHHVLLEAFVGPRPAGMVACHNDGNRYNNVIDNLRWDTHQANVRDQFRHGTAAGARNFKGATGRMRASGEVSEKMRRYFSRGGMSPEEQRIARRDATRRYRARKRLAVTWFDQHGKGSV